MSPTCSKIWVQLVDDQEEKSYSFAVPCGSWKCPHCQKVNASKLRRDIRAALAGWIEISGYNAGQFRYWAKFLTLTLPGSEWRGCHTPEDAEKVLKAGWRKLRNHLRKRYGEFEFVQVDELQPSGYPHLHVMMLGKGIASKGILDAIRAFWCGHLGLGNVDIRVIDDLDHAASYLTKYITKGKTGTLKKGNRVFSFSKGLRDLSNELKVKRSLHLTPVRVGFMNSDGSYGREIWERGSGVPLSDALEKARLNELLNFFDECKNSKGEVLFLFDETT